MDFSCFGERFLQDCGILQLMDDLGAGLRQPGAIMLGGGNPSHIPEVQAYFRESMEQILEHEREFECLIGNYAGPGGEPQFLDALVDLFRSEYKWPVSRQNIALTNGSQTAFFFLFNMFAGKQPDGSLGKILLPITPEYIGYEDVSIGENFFKAQRPQIDILDNSFFKYRVDFSQLSITSDVRALCVSRPTNPTGNVLTEDEMAKLSELAKRHGIPFIIDNAYGMPFPGIVFVDAVPRWEPHLIMCMSLSKLGLPGARTGIVVADERVIQALKGMNAVLSLAPGNFGAGLALEAVRSRQILRLSREVVRPHYEKKLAVALDAMKSEFSGVDYLIHKPEGALFLWLWLRDLPISNEELYQRLKTEGVLVVPGHYFFPGLSKDWDHISKCVRINYSGEPEMVLRGISRIAKVVRSL